MAFKADFKFTLNQRAAAETNEKIAVKWIRIIQECVGEAKKKSPPPPKIGDIPAKGHNMRSINPAGAVRADGSTHINPRNIQGEVFTTSGYGGYLETGTHKMPARPYIVPAVESVMRTVAPGILTDIL